MDRTEELRVLAFTVGKLARLDQLMAVQKSLDRALAQGKSMTEWRNNIESFFVRAGWTGNTRYRLDTIFRNNIQAAYGAGRWAQATESKEDRPYGMYDAVMDGRTRPTHAAQDGKIYHLDHPFWRQWWPPNGHRCRCNVVTLTREGAEARGGALDEIDGIPDEGFETNPGHTPGQARIFRTYVTGKLNKYSPAFRQAFLKDAAKMPFNLMSRYLHERDIESMQTLLWAQNQGGVDGYRDWVDVVAKDKLRGRVYPIGNIPSAVASRLSTEPHITLVVMDDRALSCIFQKGLFFELRVRLDLSHLRPCSGKGRLRLKALTL